MSGKYLTMKPSIKLTLKPITEEKVCSNIDCLKPKDASDIDSISNIHNTIQYNTIHNTSTLTETILY